MVSDQILPALPRINSKEPGVLMAILGRLKYLTLSISFRFRYLQVGLRERALRDIQRAMRKERATFSHHYLRGKHAQLESVRAIRGDGSQATCESRGGAATALAATQRRLRGAEVVFISSRTFLPFNTFTPFRSVSDFAEILNSDTSKTNHKAASFSDLSIFDTNGSAAATSSPAKVFCHSVFA